MPNGYDRWLEVQYHQGSGFINALFEAIARADEGNLKLLELGYPEEVHAFLLWTRGEQDGITSVFDRCTAGPLVDRARAEYDADDIEKGE